MEFAKLQTEVNNAETNVAAGGCPLLRGGGRLGEMIRQPGPGEPRRPI